MRHPKYNPWHVQGLECPTWVAYKMVKLFAAMIGLALRLSPRLRARGESNGVAMLARGPLADPESMGPMAAKDDDVALASRTGAVEATW